MMMNELKKKPNNFCGFGCLFQKSVAFVSHDRWASLRGIISSPCNEWRGFTLQPKDKKFLGKFRQPVNPPWFELRFSRIFV